MPTDETYDPDDVGPRMSPLPKPVRYILEPSSSPPPAASLPPFATPSLEPEGGHNALAKSKLGPSHCDTTLISFMANGRYIDVAQQAGKEALASEIEEEEMVKGDIMDVTQAPVAHKIGLDLQAMQIMAADVLRETARHTLESPETNVEPPPAESELMESVEATTVPGRTILYVDGRPTKGLSPERKHGTVALSTVAAGTLPPFLPPQCNPKNESCGITLPSIKHQLGYMNHYTEVPEPRASPSSQSPPNCMSIVGITTPQIGGFQCTYQGCTAAPFQTQYLLNSHANVHSQNRPHYCSVKGCPRSEGGKGFKRKNEMTRHGLVHDSPGYVCPFCSDREHKYPRPDNLQRHVRVHHVDKDKDNAQLRDVLSQRPEGPSRGRRRRGGT